MSAVASGYAAFRGYRTWYRVAGDLRAGVPLVVLHGGPGLPVRRHVR
jgi:L-proline amide hydrolase